MEKLCNHFQPGILKGKEIFTMLDKMRIAKLFCKIKWRRNFTPVGYIYLEPIPGNLRQNGRHCHRKS
jgi:hypothetical protein